ncbi:hypothetical protein X777_14929 [Ooceraea biroi]|uniref:Uncharacterized protein n=1 Tax=Ooceraea biroi TaxID=2015173 RepID=A0A026WRT0_OOCBI|nr:hypothetical protein X777_14929 [Ooceraea biroi]
MFRDIKGSLSPSTRARRNSDNANNRRASRQSRPHPLYPATRPENFGSLAAATRGNYGNA